MMIQTLNDNINVIAIIRDRLKESVSCTYHAYEAIIESHGKVTGDCVERNARKVKIT
jgi:hypothetical protein